LKIVEGKIAVVTGAASGIGRATALRLADRGCAVALAYIDRGGLLSIAKELATRGAIHSTHHVVARRREKQKSRRATATSQFGRI